MSQEVTDLTDTEYYADPYGPLDPPEHDAYMNSGYDEDLIIKDLLADEAALFSNDWEEDDDWDEGDLTEAQYQDRSWDEYDDGVFYNLEDTDD